MEKPKTTYECVICHAPAKVENGQVSRSCEHAESAVTANLHATAYGESRIAS